MKVEPADLDDKSVSDVASGGALGVGVLGYGSGGLTVTFGAGVGYGKVAVLTTLPYSTPPNLESCTV